jgi:hypothetical protein
VKSFISWLLFLILLQTSCRQDTISTPPKFTGYKNNPILNPGEPGSWDELIIFSPQVMLHENVFYLFYLGGNEAGNMAVGLATSPDGFNYSKFEGNPVLAPDKSGFDAFEVGPGIILKEDTSWVMYYNCHELAGYGPGISVGRATAKVLTGPWIRGDSPVMTAGRKGEWDDGFIIPCSVLKLENGEYRMYYTGGREISTWVDIYFGMAVSKDGYNWKKYNDPITTQHPFADSDPVFFTGKEGEWDDKNVWMANVSKHKNGFRMYYGGSDGKIDAIGYAESGDGIQWQRYHGNPVYEGKEDPDTKKADGSLLVTNPFLLLLDTICLLYYDHGLPQGTIGVASASVH